VGDAPTAIVPWVAMLESLLGTFFEEFVEWAEKASDD
jgi:hypothetical protein